MCGIVGFSGPPNLSGQSLALIKKMTDRIQKRGPDGEGHHVFRAGEIECAIGHRRLAILDLSPQGHQPKTSLSKRYSLSFNGEIYNHQELRKKLGQQFKGSSDTETILAALDAWGWQKTLPMLAGMFALAVWDHKENLWYLARDRMGEKPLYYGQVNKYFLFSSTLNALAPHPARSKDIDFDALGAVLRYGYVPGDQCIYQKMHKLAPGTWLAADGFGNVKQKSAFWSLTKVAQQGLSNPLEDAEADSKLHETLSTVIEEQRVADVPVGAFLSGGIDSSLISALLASKPINTFSAAFEGGVDESEFASAVAKHIGSTHTKLTITSQEALAVVPSLVNIYDEPFADVSQIPTALLALKAKEFVTVCLSGDGGDECFAGYNRHIYGPKLWTTLSPMPNWLRDISGTVLGTLPQWTTAAPHWLEKREKLTRAFKAKAEADIYWSMASQGLLPPASNDTVEDQLRGFTGLSSFQLRDQLMYLPDDILVKVDRASMYASLEMRAPFLDHRVVELSWRMKNLVSQGKGKQPLRRLLKKLVPEEIWDRPKTGFTPPLDKWMAGPLLTWVSDILSRQSLQTTNHPYQEEILLLWGDWKLGKPGAHRIWTAVMTQAWLLKELAH